MKNFEKWEKEVMQIVIQNKPIAVVNNKPCVCDPQCSQCRFNKNNGDMRGCIVKGFEWLYEEYKEPIKLSQLEFELLKYFSKKYDYICKEEIVYFENKSNKEWVNLEDWGEDLFAWLNKGEFPIQNILDNCEVVENVD